MEKKNKQGIGKRNAIWISIVILAVIVIFQTVNAQLLKPADPSFELSNQQNIKNLTVYCNKYAPANFDEFIMCIPYVQQQIKTPVI